MHKMQQTCWISNVSWAQVDGSWTKCTLNKYTKLTKLINAKFVPFAYQRQTQTQTVMSFIGQCKHSEMSRKKKKKKKWQSIIGTYMYGMQNSQEWYAGSVLAPSINHCQCFRVLPRISKQAREFYHCRMWHLLISFSISKLASYLITVNQREPTCMTCNYRNNWSKTTALKWTTGTGKDFIFRPSSM